MVWGFRGLGFGEVWVFRGLEFRVSYQSFKSLASRSELMWECMKSFKRA